MNLLARAKSSAHLIIPSPSPRRYLFVINHIASLEQSDLYSTRTADNSQKTQQSSKPKAQKSSEPTSSFSQRVKKEVEALTLWPRPREIPYQAKVANFVNIIGRVMSPVKCESSADGKHCAATVISQDGGKNSLLIPVVFEGDLAHVVGRHVKENDCVFVSGQLSVDPMRLVLSESLGKFHVVAENLNFVQGLKMPTSNYARKKKEILTSGAEAGEPFSPVATKLEEVNVSSESGGNNEESYSPAWRDSLEHSKVKILGRKNEWDSGNSGPDSLKLSLFNDSEAAAPLASLQGGNKGEMVFKDNYKLEKGKEVGGETASKYKDGDSWRDLIINPLQWWDYRGHKSYGLVKEKFPDFKHKATNESLWINGAPEWVLAGLGKLEFDVKPVYGKKQPAGPGPDERKSDEKGDDPWKNLVENPDKWWDNRSNKKNPKAPDFKHKETGEVLWLNRLPDWAVSKLPPLRDGQISQSF